jgi:hypothetical protein
MPRAQFSTRYGYGMLAGMNQFSVIPPLSIGRWYVRIDIVQSTFQPDNLQMRWEDGELATWEDGTPMEWEAESFSWDNENGTPVEWEDGELAAWESIPSTNAIPSWRWYGVVEVTADQQSATPTVGNIGVATGDRTYLAYGMESLLDRHRIASADWKRALDNTLYTSKSGLTFNEGGRGNRSSDVDGDRHHFFYWTDEGAARDNRWSTRDIVSYLIRSTHGVPISPDGDDTLRWVLATSDRNRLPKWDSPEIETHLVSAYDLLNTLISRRRLLSWWLEVDEVLGVIRIRTATMTDVEIELLPPDGKIDQNQNTVHFAFDNHASADVVSQSDTSHSVDQVIAYGARRTNTVTLEFGTSTGDFFRSGWTEEQKEEYETAGSDKSGYPDEAEVAERRRWHSLYRAKDTVRTVFSRWVLNEKANYPPNDPDGYRMFFGAVRLMPYLPLLEGVKYDGLALASTSFNFPEGVNKLDRRPPLVVIEIPDQPGKYVKLNDIGRNGETEPRSDADVRDWSATIRIPKDGHSLTIDVARAPQHTLAHDTFSPREEDEITHGHWDWRTMKATVAIADERFAEGRYPEDNDVPDLDAKRTIRIPAGINYRLDWVAEQTIVEVDPDGNPLTVNATDGGYINDDRPKLNQIAKAAYQWYSRERNAIRVRWPWDDQAGQLRIGQYITAMTQNGIAQPIGSLITQLELSSLTDYSDEPRDSMPPMMTSIHAAFGELDYLRLRAVGAKGKKKDSK